MEYKYRFYFVPDNLTIELRISSMNEDADKVIHYRRKFPFEGGVITAEQIEHVRAELKQVLDHGKA